jgi:predicted nucleotide-binding protein
VTAARFGRRRRPSARRPALGNPAVDQAAMNEAQFVTGMARPPRMSTAHVPRRSSYPHRYRSANVSAARILRLYWDYRLFLIGERTAEPAEFGRQRVTFTSDLSEGLVPTVRQEHRQSPVMTTITGDWYLANKGHRLADELIAGPPESDMASTSASRGAEAFAVSRPDPRSVFVVHGRNQQARDAIYAFLRALGLKPVEWNEAVLATGRPNPYIGEVLDAAFAHAQTVLVLMTPDDEARLRDAFHEPGDPPHETSTTPQARPNVIFEAGLAIGRDENRVVLVEFGACRPFADISGRHTLQLNGTTQRRQELALRLESAGAAVNMTGTDWHTAGDFSPPA